MVLVWSCRQAANELPAFPSVDVVNTSVPLMSQTLSLKSLRLDGRYEAFALPSDTEQYLPSLARLTFREQS
jgi:hypothetical protein